MTKLIIATLVLVFSSFAVVAGDCPETNKLMNQSQQVLGWSGLGRGAGKEATETSCIFGRFLRVGDAVCEIPRYDLWGFGDIVRIKRRLLEEGHVAIDVQTRFETESKKVIKETHVVTFKNTDEAKRIADQLFNLLNSGSAGLIIDDCAHGMGPEEAMIRTRAEDISIVRHIEQNKPYIAPEQ